MNDIGINLKMIATTLILRVILSGVVGVMVWKEHGLAAGFVVVFALMLLAEIAYFLNVADVKRGFK